VKRIPEVSVTVGVEVEGLVYKKGERYDLKRYLAPYGGVIEVPGFGRITTDLGKSQVEYITEVCRSGDEVVHRLNTLERTLCDSVSGVRVEYGPFFERAGSVEELLTHPWQHPRAIAQVRALQSEWERVLHTSDWRVVSELACLCSTHVHLGLTNTHGVFLKHTDPAVRPLYLALGNVLTNCGPYLARRLAERSGIADHPGRQTVWFRFTTKNRRPRKGTWLYGDAAYARRIRSMGPRLVRRGCDSVCGVDTWEVDLETPSREGDPIVLKTCWDQARLSPLGTVESRSGQSVPPEHAGWYAEKLLEVSRGTIEWLRKSGSVLNGESDVERLFRSLHGIVGDLVPPAPLTEEEWWECANLR